LSTYFCSFVLSLLSPVGRKSAVAHLERGEICLDIVFACAFLECAVMIRQLPGIKALTQLVA
jgi:hypothetical protein